MGTILTLRNWIVFSLAWCAFVGYLAWQGWPRLPFDSGIDAGTQMVLKAAICDHVLVHMGLAVVVPLILLGLGQLIRRSRGTAS